MGAVSKAYPIGTPGKPWGVVERAAWRESRTIQRSYDAEVLRQLEALKLTHDKLVVEQYGALPHDPQKYPLYAVRSEDWSATKPSVLVTGGVHGYETSGVQGAILFLQKSALSFARTFNVLVVPCVSPWGYETIQRWNAQAVDPNRSFNPAGEVVPGRSFNPESATDESAALIALLERLAVEQWTCHIDLHETTDSDETEFRPAKSARDGMEYKPDAIPDGFYLVSDSTNPQAEWHRAMINAVRKVTHIAPADDQGKIIGEPVVQEGVIAIPSPRTIGLCAGVTNAFYATTTEVYPDSPQASDEQCNRAQLAAIETALEFIIGEMQLGGSKV
uniref:Peptidase M14 domain-containing protein n=1 Tax=Coccolithus braarudii TaxID=221442 RepID=A0A7S0QAM7_9EUKA